ncbi:MAG: hypothetical protein ACXIUB_00120 [Wenzhouxiangella sp.]
MSNNTRKLLLALSENPSLASEFKHDPKAVMDRYEVPEAHQTLIREGDQEGLKKAAGLDDETCRLIIF